MATLWALYRHPTLSNLHIFALLFLSLRMSVPASAWQDPTTVARLPPPGRPLGLPPSPRAHLSSLPSLIAVDLVSDPLVSWAYLSPVLCSGRWTVALSALASCQGQDILGATAGSGLRAPGGLGFSEGNPSITRLPLGRPLEKLPSVLQHQCLSNSAKRSRPQNTEPPSLEPSHTPHFSARGYPGCQSQLCRLLLYLG